MKIAVLLSGLSYVPSKTVPSPTGPKQITIDFRDTLQCIKNVSTTLGDTDYFLCTNQHDRLAELEKSFMPKVLLLSNASNMGKRNELLNAFKPYTGDYDLVVHTRFDIYLMVDVKRCMRPDSFNIITRDPTRPQSLKHLHKRDWVCDNFILFPTRLLTDYEKALNEAGSWHSGHAFLCELPNIHIMNNERSETWRNVSYWIRPHESRPFLRRWSDYTDAFVYKYGVKPSTLRKHAGIITLDAFTPQGCFWGEIRQQGTARICFNVTSDVEVTLLLLKRRGQFCCKGLGLKHSEFAYPTDADTSIEVKRIELHAGVQQHVNVDVDMHWSVQPGDVGSGFWIAEVKDVCRLQIEMLSHI